MALEIKADGDMAYKRGYNEKETLVKKVYDSLTDYQQNPNNSLYKYIFGKVLNNITACDRLGKRTKALRVYPHRLSGQQVRYLKRASRLADNLKVPMAEVIGICSHVGEIASTPINTIICLAKMSKEVDELRGHNVKSDSEYRCDALSYHINNLEQGHGQ